MSPRSHPVSVVSSWADSKLLRLENRAGLCVSLLPNGAIGSIEHRGILVNQFADVVRSLVDFEQLHVLAADD